MSSDVKGFIAVSLAVGFFIGWVIDFGYLLGMTPDWALPFVAFLGIGISFPVFYAAWRFFMWLLGEKI